MAQQNEYPGRLIAVDGTRGKDVRAAAEAVIAALQDRRIDCAISRFDASGLFGELAGADRNGKSISARTLTLVYAADLAFRLRWEVRPVLEAGGIVIAAPYVDTAVAIGTAHGLDEEWIRELLRFAATPRFRARADEKKLEKSWKARLNRGYGEYCAAMLDEHASKDALRSARSSAIAMLQRPRGRKMYRLAGEGIAELARAITGTKVNRASRA